MVNEKINDQEPVIDLRSSKLAEDQQRRIKEKWSKHEANSEEDNAVEAGKIEEIDDGEVVDAPKKDIKETREEEIKEINQEVLGYFEDLSINEKELNSTEGFNNLSEGQQLLILENLKQISLGRIKKEALSEQKSKLKTFTSKKGKFWQLENDASDTYQHLKTLSQNIWINGIKNFANNKVAKLEKLKVEDMEKGGMEVYGAILEQLIAGMVDNKGIVKEDALEIEKIENKKGGYELDVKYLAVLDDMNKKEKKSVEKFNKSASEFSKIPDQWSDKTAKAGERLKYKNAKKRYEKSKNKIINIKAKQSGNQNAMLEMNDIDYRLKMNQSFNSHPDVEEQIQNIKNKTAWKRAMGSMFRERGFQFGAGFMSRTATMALGGAAGLSVALSAPAAVLGLGAHRAVKRGKKSLDEGYELSRWTTSKEAKQEGKNEADFLSKYAEIKQKIKELEKKDEDEIKPGYKGEIGDHEDEIKKYKKELKVLDKQEAQKLLAKKDFVDADYLSDSFEDLISELENENFVASLKLENKKQQKIKDNRRDEMLKSLMFHIQETQEKLNNKTVNFGGEDEFLPNQYRLVEQLSKAEGLVSTHEVFKDIDLDKLEEKYAEDSSGIQELVYNIQNKKISKAKRNYLLGKAGIGVAASATFFVLGSHVRDCVGEYVPDSMKKFASDTYSNIKRDISKLGLDSNVIDVELDKDVMETLKNLSEQDKEYIAKHGLSEYMAQQQLNAPLASNFETDAVEKIEPVKPAKIGDVEDMPTQEPTKGASKEVVEEFEKTVKKQEAIKDIAAKVAEQEAAINEHGIKNNFKIKLGENEVPARLERTMYAFAMDAMDEKDMYTEIEKDGVKLFDEEPAARSLNVAANLTKMAEGELEKIKGVKISDEMRNSFKFNKKTGELEIKNHTEFNNLVKNLHGHAEKLWDNEILQKEAVGYLDRIDKGAWKDIIEANGLEKQVEGHDNLDLEVKNFEKSEMVQKAEEVIRAREAEELADLKEIKSTKAEIPQGLGAEKNVSESFKKTLEIFNVSGLKNIKEIYETAGVNPENGLDRGEIERLEFLAQRQDLIGNNGEVSEIFELMKEMDSEEAYEMAEILKNYKEIDKSGHVEFIKKYSGLFKAEYIKEIYEQMPDSIRNNGEQALNYLKISTGNDDEVSSGFKNMLNLGYKPQSDAPYGFSKDLKTGILTLHNIDGKEGVNVLVDLENNKIGVQVEGSQKNWGIKSFFGLGKRYPTENLTMENLKGVKEFLGGKNSEVITEEVELSDKNEVNKEEIAM